LNFFVAIVYPSFLQVPVPPPPPQVRTSAQPIFWYSHRVLGAFRPAVLFAVGEGRWWWGLWYCILQYCRQQIQPYISLFTCQYKSVNLRKFNGKSRHFVYKLQGVNWFDVLAHVQFYSMMGEEHFISYIHPSLLSFFLYLSFIIFVHLSPSLLPPIFLSVPLYMSVLSSFLLNVVQRQTLTKLLKLHTWLFFFKYLAFKYEIEVWYTCS
jgi:hypothetical protein